MDNDNIFYSIDWRQEVFFPPFPFFDVMVDLKYLYIIEIPKLPLWHYRLWSWAISDLQKRKYYNKQHEFYLSDETFNKKYRLSWLDSNQKLISQNYDKDVFLKVPLGDLRGNIKFNKNKFTLTYNGKKIILFKQKASLKFEKSENEEFSYFKKLLEKYV